MNDTLNVGILTGKPSGLADLIDEIAQLINRYSSLPNEHDALLAACWIIQTYCYEWFQYCGYLALRSATPRCGKSRTLRLIGALCLGSPKPMTTPTAAVLFRNPSKVLILDEVDRLRNADKEKFGDVMGVLNAGYEKGGVVQRNVPSKGGDWVPKAFDVYGPKALAGIEFLTDTLADRTFMIPMRRAPRRLPRLNLRHLQSEINRLCSDIQTWVKEHQTQIETAYDQLPDSLECLARFDDRLQDIAEPLVVLASLADEERSEGPAILLRLLGAISAAAEQREPCAREMTLWPILKIAKVRIGDNLKVFVPSNEFVECCTLADATDWIDSPRKLAGFLRNFDLRPRESPDGQCRGYWLTREWVEEWQSQYPIPHD